jgi:hypothetical protein
MCRSPRDRPFCHEVAAGFTLVLQLRACRAEHLGRNTLQTADLRHTRWQKRANEQEADKGKLARKAQRRSRTLGSFLVSLLPSGVSS